MTQKHDASLPSLSSMLGDLGLKTHRLMARSAAVGLQDELQTLLYVNDHMLAPWAKANEAARQEAIRQQEEGHTRYIWRTSGDNRVRSSHAANEGRVFAWDSPPPTGHPGEDYGCRCTAEPYKRGEAERAEQNIAVQAEDSPLQWEDANFISYFYFGGGNPVFLQEMGHLNGIIQYYFYTLGAYSRVNSQIIAEARKHESGTFEYHFDGPYGFKPYLFSIGGAVIAGVFRGTISHVGDMMIITGTVDYVFSDTFTDIFNEREEQIGTSDPSAATPEMLEETEHGGTYYAINGYWQTNFYAEANRDEEESRYR